MKPVCRLFYVMRLLLRRRELRSQQRASLRNSEKESKTKRYVVNKTGKIRLEDRTSFLGLQAGDLRQLKLKRDKPYRMIKNGLVIGIRNNEMRLEHELSSVIRLRSRLKGSIRNHSLKDMSAPLMVYFYHFLTRSISI